ncbi:YciI family protein [Urbifossiella limnaea]|uniref:YCII-related domain protein n=1 Tax=Urbifossiella limnaea TaxID=2528023 RepID=A0A517Y138_9BACT|nr:YciI family protein [Urbifossiella limnaea]QDU23475.1 YCII-related domain protein [Urbifossiella limnaea]
MHYLLLAYGCEADWTDAERADCMVESLAACDRLAAQGKYLAASPLLPASTASTTRVRDGRPLVTDGPFAETTEHLGGFFLLDLADLDEAIAVAAALPPARKGTIEIRPVLELRGEPQPPPGAVALLGYGDSAAAADATAAVRLRPADTATCVRVRGGVREVSDGPFDAAAAQLGSVSVGGSAADHPAARTGAVETRPLFDLTPVRATLSPEAR